MKRKLLFWSFLGLLLSYLGLNYIDSILQNGNLDFGIIAFELAGNLTASNIIIQEWIDGDIIHLASFSLGFDFLFMLFYVAFLSFWTSVLADSFYKNSHRYIATIVISLFIIAGILDGIENYALLNLLGENNNEEWSVMAFYCASIKFGLIGLGIIYNLVVSIGKLFVKIQ